MSLFRAAYTLLALNAIHPQTSSFQEACCQRTSELPPTQNATLGSFCFISLVPVTHLCILIEKLFFAACAEEINGYVSLKRGSALRTM